MTWSFIRQLSLGEGVDSDNLTAGYADGVPAGGSRTISGSAVDQGEAPAGGTGGVG